MTDDERLQIQLSTTLSGGLIAAAFAVLAGVAAAFAGVAEKVRDGTVWTAVILVWLVSASSLIASIFFGGRGISKTSAVVGTKPTVLPERFDGGNFNRQAVAGLVGLVLAVVAFVVLGTAPSWQPRREAVTDENVRIHLEKVEQALREIRDEIRAYGGRAHGHPQGRPHPRPMVDPR